MSHQVIPHAVEPSRYNGCFKTPLSGQVVFYGAGKDRFATSRLASYPDSADRWIDGPGTIGGVRPYPVVGADASGCDMVSPLCHALEVERVGALYTSVRTKIKTLIFLGYESLTLVYSNLFKQQSIAAQRSPQFDGLAEKHESDAI